MTQCHDKAVSHSTISGLSENEVMVYVSSILTTSTNYKHNKFVNG